MFSALPVYGKVEDDLKRRYKDNIMRDMKWAIRISLSQLHRKFGRHCIESLPQISLWIANWPWPDKMAKVVCTQWRVFSKVSPRWVAMIEWRLDRRSSKKSKLMRWANVERPASVEPSNGESRPESVRESNGMRDIRGRANKWGYGGREPKDKLERKEGRKEREKKATERKQRGKEEQKKEGRSEKIEER